MDISVIVPYYNNGKKIFKCLESLLIQKQVTFEVIVVDDGSKPALEKLPETSNILKDVRVILFRIKHAGAGMARNHGGLKAKGKILVFADSDMTFDDKYLYQLTSSILRGKTKGTYTGEEYVSNWDKPLARCWNYNLGLKDRVRVGSDYEFESPVFRAILKKEFVKAGGFDPIGYTDDWTLSRKLGYKAKKAEGAFCYHDNPQCFKEVIGKAFWIGKNEFNTRGFRKFAKLLVHFFPLSVFWGLVKSVSFREPMFLPFKIVYDLGISKGIFSNLNGDNPYA